MKCKECGSNDLKWFASTRNSGTAVDGRLRMNEVHVIFVLGCEECSETVRIISGDQAADLLNEAAGSVKEQPFVQDFDRGDGTFVDAHL